LSLSLPFWRGCLRSSSAIVASKGKKLKNKATQNKNHLKVSQVQIQYSFSKFFSMQVLFGCCLIKGRWKKKESGDSSVNGICGCGLPAHCCQSTVAGGFIYADLWGELSTHVAPQTLFT
jgi:hypothetical protein